LQGKYWRGGDAIGVSRVRFRSWKCILMVKLFAPEVAKTNARYAGDLMDFEKRGEVVFQMYKTVYACGDTGSC